MSLSKYVLISLHCQLFVWNNNLPSENVLIEIFSQFGLGVQCQKWNKETRQRAYCLLKCIKLRAYHADTSVKISNLTIIPSKHANMKNKLGSKKEKT